MKRVAEQLVKQSSAMKRARGARRERKGEENPKFLLFSVDKGGGGWYN